MKMGAALMYYLGCKVNNNLENYLTSQLSQGELMTQSTETMKHQNLIINK